MAEGAGVLIDRAALSLIQATALRAGFRHEVGGVLLGSYRDPHLHVSQATPPQSGDRWTFTRFWRSPAGHQRIAREAWIRSRETVTYLGEWHSHSERVPQPSSIDRADWARKLCEQCRDLAFLIQGVDGHYLELASQMGRRFQLRPHTEDGASILYLPVQTTAPNIASEEVMYLGRRQSFSP